MEYEVSSDESDFDVEVTWLGVNLIRNVCTDCGRTLITGSCIVCEQDNAYISCSLSQPQMGTGVNFFL